MRLVLAARQSHLARVQAKTVGSLLEQTFSDLEVVYAFRESLGDINASDPLWQMPEKGVFTEDFVEDLAEGRCHLVVHSWKDLPTEEREHSSIVATLPREDARDVLLVHRDRIDAVVESRRIRVLTSSPRRIHNLSSFLPRALPWKLDEVEFVPVRGNIPTRLKKLLRGDGDGLVVAKAALDRLLSVTNQEFFDVRDEIRKGLDECLWMVLPLSANPTAAAQGALALEVADANADVLERVRALNHRTTFEDVQTEREILASHGGGCHQKIGVHVSTKRFGRVTSLQGEREDGLRLDQWSLESTDLPPVPESSEAIWPQDGVRPSLFKRQEIPGEKPDVEALWVAKANALPGDWKVGPETVVWTSGLTTWEKLAERGVWVNGSAEGLGEGESPRVDVVHGREPRWLKLTHEGGYERENLPILGTYRLEDQDPLPDLKGKTHLFWSSGSLFRRALKEFPEIAGAYHASGPGNTAAILRETLGDHAHVSVFLNYQSWLDHVTQ